MSYQHVAYEKKNRIAYITINRPQVLNALHTPAVRELSEVCADFRDDPDVWVAILTGAGRAFSVGADLKYAAEHTPEAVEREQVLIPGGHGAITNHFECWKPIIAAINGFALGAGFEIVLACDIVVAAQHARLGLPEVTVGFMAGAGGVHRLARQIPLKLAMGMILTGRQITAEEAFRLGLVNEVVPAEDLMPAAERWARDILKCAPLAVRASKEATMRGLDLPLSAAMNNRYFTWTLAQNSEDFREGPRAFAEKRSPQWKGC